VHPVLYLKPANTWIGAGQPIVLPAGVEEVEVGATLGVVMGRATARVREQDALALVGGYVAVNDVTVPHANVLRPPLKQKCRDTFCPMSGLVDAARVADPDALVIRAYVNGALQMENSTANLVRRVARLIAEVTEFMTLDAGDVLLVGVPEGAPRARAGDRVAVEIVGVARVDNPVEQERPAP
jgi:5-oxopent-3-ene-1,2,5-tricarboxylate decarboxylase/2-hydroxyhepta-2,4-diene-1,7-dioate isomerase